MTQPKSYVTSNRSASRTAGYYVKPRPRSSVSQPWLLGSIALAAFIFVFQDLWSRVSMPISTVSQSAQPWQSEQAKTSQTCQTVLNADQRLSRGQLTQFLSIAQNSSQATVHETIAPPYCTLSKAHQSKQNEAYPLACDPATWFVVNYDQGIYKGYDFVFRE